MRLAFLIATRSIFNRRSKYAHSAIGWIAIIGLMLGVASQTVTLSILAGFEKTFTESILGFNADLFLNREGEIDHPQKILAELESNPQIRSITPFLYREGLVAHHSKVKGVVLKGIDPLTFQKVYGVTFRLFSASPNFLSLFSPENQKSHDPPIIVGSDLAKELGVSDQERKISILSPQGDLKNITAVNNFKNFEVIGTFSSGLYEYDSQFALLDLTQAQKFFGVSNQVTGFEMKIADLKRAKDLAVQLREKFGFPYQVVPWDELNSEIFEALKLEKKLFFILMGLMIAVAAANLIGLIVVLVSGQSKEIAILKAMGMSTQTLNRIFTLQGVLLALVGIFFGVILGSGICALLKTYSLIELAREVYLVSSLPILFSVKNILLIVAFSFLVSYLTASLASRRLVKSKLERL